MMLSICISVRYSSIATLIERLYDQAQALNIPVEICIAESGSNSAQQKANQEAANTYKANYQHFKHYLSHGQMKNTLAGKAKGAYLLLIHGDMHITHKKYLEFYTEVMQPGMVVHGGISAGGIKPRPPFQLHWHAMQSLLTYHSDERNKHPYFHLCTNNMLIPRGIFLQYPTPDSDDITGILPYSFRLKTNKIPVIHIDNPIATSTYLSDKRFLVISRRQMQQTALWLKKTTGDEKAHLTINEYLHMKKLQKWRLVGLYKLIYRINANMLLSNIEKNKSSKLHLYRNFRRWILMEPFFQK